MPVQRLRNRHIVDPLDCHACRLCVDACPEHALHLAPITTVEAMR
jgi:NAD-dependent dihydropyrimidine dehydrogenase PreA subunit